MPPCDAPSGLVVEITPFSPVDAFAELESSWRDLEQFTQTQFFLSWDWIGHWLMSLPNSMIVHAVSVYQGDELIALSVFSMKKRNSLFGKVTQGYLHRAGCDALDQIWIENNAVLTKLTDKAQIASLYVAIMERTSLDELLISVMSERDYIDPAIFADQHKGHSLNIEYEENGYAYSIMPDTDLESRYSKSLHRQIKQTVSEAKALGMQLRFESVSDPKEMLALFDASSPWHVDKWRGTDTPSGFENPHFTHFHRALIKNVGVKCSERRVRMFALWNKGELLGVTYGFQDANWFGFYLSCIKPVTENRLRFGLYMHHMAIHAMATCGVTVYDFMAGEARYKRQFGSVCSRYGKVVIQRNTFSTEVERWLKKVKKRLKKYV